MTQEELGELLGLRQTAISEYERGKVRLNGELIVQLSKVLKVSADELLGLKPSGDDGRIANRRLLRRLHLIDRLPRRDQQALLRTIDAYLSKAR